MVIDIPLLFPHVAKFCFWSYGPKYCSPIKLQDSLKCNSPRKKQIIKFIFGIQIKIEIFYKLILSFWVCVARHAQSTQDKKFPNLCNSPKNVGNEVDFLPANKYQNFYKLIVSVWVCVVCYFQSTQNSKFAISQGKCEG